MSDIKSDNGLVASHANSFSAASSQIGAASQVDKDAISRLEGNSRASEEIDHSSTVSADIAGKITSFSQLLQSVAEEFQATDQGMAADIEG